VRLAYVDESHGGGQHWVCAVLVDPAGVNALHRSLHDVVEAVEEWGIDEESELHAYELFHGVGSWEELHGSPRLRIGVYAAALRAIAAVDAVVILRGVSTTGLARRYGDFADAHRVTMSHLIERVDEWCAKEDDHALIVADEHHETESALLRDLRIYQESRTWGYRSRKIERVVDTIHFVSSHTNRLVQVADLVAFLAHRQATVEERDHRAIRANAALWSIVEPMLWHHWCWYP
jgi:hypothetical protein